MKATLKEYSEEEYDEMLDDVYGKVSIAWYDWFTSVALYKLDPIAYNCWYSDWESCQEEIRICGECDSEHETEAEANECCQEVLPTKK